MEQFGVIHYFTYLVGVVMIVLLPGPNSLYVLALAAQLGVRAGWLAACGIFVGDALLMLATAAGAVTLLKTHPLLFHFVQYVGAIYLAYLGVRLVWSAAQLWQQRHVPPLPSTPAEVVVAIAPFSKALLISLLNPKAILFFLSFFVQFVDPAYPEPAIPFLVLAISLQFFSALYLGMLIYGGNYLADAFQERKRLSALSAGVVGAAFMAFAVKLATASVA